MRPNLETILKFYATGPEDALYHALRFLQMAQPSANIITVNHEQGWQELLADIEAGELDDTPRWDAILFDRFVPANVPGLPAREIRIAFMPPPTHPEHHVLQ